MINYCGQWFEIVDGLLVPVEEVLRRKLLAEAQELADQSSGSKLNLYQPTAEDMRELTERWEREVEAEELADKEEPKRFSGGIANFIRRSFEADEVTDCDFIHDGPLSDATIEDFL